MATVTKTIDGWLPRDQHVERLLDNAAYTAAHPDDTLLLAGPARWNTADPSLDPSAIGSLLPIGMVQQFQVSQNVPVAPIPAIGTSRVFYTRSKAQISWSMSRLWCNGRNLLRALYHNAVVAGLNPKDLPEPGSATAGNQAFLNLESELFAAPLGMLMIFRDKSRNPLASFYTECMMISSWNVGIAAGTNMIVSNVTGLADRLVPVDLTTSNIQASIDAVNSFVDTAALDVADVAIS